MGRVTGLGGVFFKAENPEKLYEWYEKHLGIKQDVPGQGVSFRWKEDGDPEGFTIWSLFKPDTKYFQPSTKPFMLNFRVEDLDDKEREYVVVSMTPRAEVQTADSHK